MAPPRKIIRLQNTTPTAWLIERLGAACLYAIVFCVWLTSVRRRAAINHRPVGRPYGLRAYFLEATAMVRILFLMSLASILRLK
jgi:hypothetical protein